MPNKITTPSDFIPTVGLSFGPENQTATFVTADSPLPVTSASGAAGASAANSTQSALTADATFAGDWEVNSQEHVVINVLADQPGTLWVDFAIVKDGEDASSLTDADVVQTLNAPQEIYAHVPYFRVLVKGAGRAFRVRYVNGPTGQTSMSLFVAYGSNLFPPSVSADNELLTTTKKSLNANFFAYGASDIGATEYGIAIDLSDTASYPHSNTGAIVLSAVYLTVDKANTSQGGIQIGIITRIDETDADIEYVQGFSFEKSGATSIVRDRDFGLNTIHCGVSGGTLSRVASNFTATGVTAVNTSGTLPTSLGGTATPAVGDAVVLLSHTSGGDFNPAISGFYYTERS